MKNTVFILLAGLCSLMIACQPAAVDQPKVDLDAARAEIQALEDAYAKASNEKNVDGILAYYSDDAQRLPDGAPTVKGKAGLRKQIQDDMASDTTGSTVRFEVVDVFADGNLLVEVGASIVTAKDGKEKSRGKYVAVYEKRDGKYLCVRDIWNEDADDDDDDDAGDDAED
ncbi:MAG TPA: DUF4440 domain-containing protein [Saprospiraceae bacterium]|nr:DUF4440 domain-containing protein [Saprospiraceae bacterium]